MVEHGIEEVHSGPKKSHSQAQPFSVHLLAERNEIEQSFSVGSQLNLGQQEPEASEKLLLDVLGPRWVSDNLLQGHFEYTIKLSRAGLEHSCVEVERRYSDFEILRQALVCEFPGLIIPRLPAKDASVAFQQADSESIQARL